MGEPRSSVVTVVEQNDPNADAHEASRPAQLFTPVTCHADPPEFAEKLTMPVLPSRNIGEVRLAHKSAIGGAAILVLRKPAGSPTLLQITATSCLTCIK